MLQRTTRGRPVARPLRPLRVLIEDPQLVAHRADVMTAMDITVCGGPCGERETCPLVMDGHCLLGPFDVVVSALDGQWARSVSAAWAETPTPVIDARDLASVDPDERLAHHLGAALQALWVSPRSVGDVPQPSRQRTIVR